MPVQQIGRVKVAGAVAGSMTLGQIPATYSALLGVVSGRGDTAAVVTAVNGQFNADAGNNYISFPQIGTGTPNTSSSLARASFFGDSNNGSFPGNNATANHSGQMIFLIPDYAGTDFFKTYQILGGVAAFNVNGAFMLLGLGSWEALGAITSIKVFPAAGNFKIGSSFTLWGLP